METFSGFFQSVELLQTKWFFLVGYLPLGLIGVWRWSVWSVKKVISFFYCNPPGQYTTSLSIVTPVYNEDPAMFQLALLSWKENNPEEIIAVIDYTDKKCIKIFKSFSRDFPRSRLIITRVPGKRAALANGIKVATSEIVALTDSDTVWTRNLKEKILGPFADKKVGGVAPQQDVMEVDTLAKKLFRIHIFNRYGNDLIFQAAFGNALSCISGRTGVYRYSAISHLMKELVNEKFLGKKCISGDDKCLTHLIQRDGWKVKYLEKALVYTPGFPDLKTYTKQQIRWTRNSWRADLKALFSRWLWKNPFLAFHSIDRFFQPFCLLLGPIFLVIALYKGEWIVALALLAWWLASRSIRIINHLNKHPADIMVLPSYVIYCYILAVIKIFTLVSVDEQSWITRWNKKRLSRSSIFKRSFSYAATAVIISLLFFVSFEVNVRLVGAKSFYQKAQLEKEKAEKKFFQTDDQSRLVKLSEKQFKLQEEALYRKVMADQFGYYQAKAWETTRDIKRRYLLPPEAIIYTQDKVALKDGSFVGSGDQLAIAVSDLRAPNLDFYRQKSLTKIRITQDFAEQAVRIKGQGAFFTLPELERAIQNKAILENLGEGNWILRKNLYIDNGATLIIDGAEVSWLKLKSGRNGFVWIKAENGNLVAKKTKITSWDEEKADYDLDWQDGRSYILQKSDGRMDISESELAYLGYLGSPQRGNPYGGPYGISWKITNGSFRRELSTGSLIGNSIHHNLFGIYTYGASGAVFANNDVFNNMEYGIDPHDDSNNLLIEGNRVYENGNHGIIASKRCFANIFRSNFSHNNRLHGIMLDRESNNNLVERNRSTGNINGLAINDSSENLVLNNSFTDNQFGIRANNFSKNNYFSYNSISSNRKGILLYQDSPENYLFQNKFSENDIKIHLKENSTNFFSDEDDKRLFFSKNFLGEMAGELEE